VENAAAALALRGRLFCETPSDRREARFERPYSSKFRARLFEKQGEKDKVIE